MRRTFPNRTYRDTLTLDIGGRTVRLTEITGDSSHATMAWVPNDRLLLTGDALVAPVTWTTQSFAISPWLDSLRAMAALDPRFIVPGHGPLMRDLGYLRLVVDYMESARAQVRTALAGGAITPDEVAARVDLSAFRTRFAGTDASLGETFDAYMPSLVRKLYLEQRDGMDRGADFRRGHDPEVPPLRRSCALRLPPRQSGGRPEPVHPRLARLAPPVVRGEPLPLGELGQPHELAPPVIAARPRAAPARARRRR